MKNKSIELQFVPVTEIKHKKFLAVAVRIGYSNFGDKEANSWHLHDISNMKLDEIVAWYQKKLGTYDKQQWEKTVEQKILDGFNSVTLKTAKLKTELIDVDLVRGSTFPKAKPKQTLLTVIRLAIQRYFLLPVYAQWWVKQTSPNAFALLFALYILQMINWAIYTFNTNRGLDENLKTNHTIITKNADPVGNENIEEHIVSISDLLIPMVLSLILSLIHSQIVATNTVAGVKSKRRRFSNANSNGGINTKSSREPRLRRRKKLVKLRSQELIETNISQRKTISSQTLKNKSTSTIAVEQLENLASGHNESNYHKIISSNSNKTKPSQLTPTKNDSLPSPASLLNNKSSYQSQEKFPAKNLTLDLINTVSSTDVDALPATSLIDCLDDSQTGSLSNHKKRNVNWHSPIHNYAIETQEKQQQTSPQTYSSQSATATATTTSSSEANTPNNFGNNGEEIGQSSSENSENSSALGTLRKTVRIDDCVQEFYEELIVQADAAAERLTMPVANSQAARAQNMNNIRRAIGEDDGFESLNGKSSSGEEMHASLLPTTSSSIRLRLNVGRDNEAANSLYRRKAQVSSESDVDKSKRSTSVINESYQPKKSRSIEEDVTTDHTDEDGDDIENVSGANSNGGNNSNYTECTTSATEWLGVTTNSDECSYSSELENTDDYNKNQQYSDEDGYEMDFAPTTILNPHGSSDRISCTIWEQREIKKAQMSVLEISSWIVERVESMPETNDYIYMGIVFSFLLSFVPTFCRLCEVTIDSDKSNELSYWDLPMLLWEKASFSFYTLFHFAFGQTQWERTVLIIGLVERFCLTMLLFMIFAVAERTFKQRFLYAKLFSHLTSSRRARKSNLPHFRLNKVRNIKSWLCVRSYLKKRGPQRSVDVIVSAAFIITHLLLAFLSVEWLKDSVHLHSHLNLEALMWSSTIGIFLLRFMTLGNKIHQKYRSISVLITEQINLYLQIEQKPKKKEELMVSNSVLKLAADLLKELESPFKVSGLRANPYLFTTIKVVILSALSGVLSEMLGFKLKLLKIKIK